MDIDDFSETSGSWDIGSSAGRTNSSCRGPRPNDDHRPSEGEDRTSPFATVLVLHGCSLLMQLTLIKWSGESRHLCRASPSPRLRERTVLAYHGSCVNPAGPALTMGPSECASRIRNQPILYECSLTLNNSLQDR